MHTATLHHRVAPVGMTAQLRAAAQGLWRRATTPPAQTRVEEAAAVREMADCVRESDPGFASDLYAAADRHERLADSAA